MHRDIVMGDREWSSFQDSQWRNVNPREYFSWVQASRRLLEICYYAKFMEREDQVLGEDEGTLKLLQGVHAHDEFIWPPVSPREEMKNEQAMLAMVNIFDEA